MWNQPKKIDEAGKNKLCSEEKNLAYQENKLQNVIAKKKNEPEIISNEIIPEVSKSKIKNIYIFIAAIVFTGVLINIAMPGIFNDSSLKLSSTVEPQINKALDPNLSYRELRGEILSSGWKIYKRTNELKGWDNKIYPELDYCYEDYCGASFISLDGTKVREIHFAICREDGYFQCPNKPKGFLEVDKDNVKAKSISDIDFLKIKEKFDD